MWLAFMRRLRGRFGCSKCVAGDVKGETWREIRLVRSVLGLDGVEGFLP